jgi:hypothetical protein
VIFNEPDQTFRFVDEFLKGYVVKVRYTTGEMCVWVSTTGHTPEGHLTLKGWEYNQETSEITDNPCEVEWSEIRRIEIL